MLKRSDAHVSVEATGQSLFPLAVDDLSFGDRGRTLIDRMTFALDGRGTTVVMGANGAGKSLLLRLLHGLLVPTHGSISWGGKPLDASIRSRQAMVFQRPTLLRRSTADNLRFVLNHLPRDERERKVDALISEAKLQHAATTPARLLSGGEQQRLVLARARAGDPEVLFLDEPAASLDPASTHAIEELIRSIRADGIKVILVTHDRGQARRLADDVLFISHGRMAEQAAATTFFEGPATEAARAYLEGRLEF